MSYDYVWSKSSTDTSLPYRISAVWSGGEGAVLLWTWFMSLVVLAGICYDRRANLNASYRSFFIIVSASIVLLFALILIGMDLFAATDSAALASCPDGCGLKPVLATPEMALHPPVIFASYASCLGLFAASISFFWARESDWSSISLSWGRVTWILLTLGIGIGSVWAYYVIGWGGYWYWDPVETVSLIPFLLVSAFLHTLRRNREKREYMMSAPLLGALSFCSIIFATFVTRTGGIWGSSIHTYGSSSDLPLGSRLLDAIGNDPTVMGIFSLLVVSISLTVVSAVFAYRYTGASTNHGHANRLSDLINDRNSIMASVILLVTIAIMLVAFLVKNADASASDNYAELNQKMSVFFCLLMLTLAVSSVWRVIGRRNALLLSVGASSFSVILAAYSYVTGSFDTLLAFTVPIYALAIGSIIVKVSNMKYRGRLKPHLYKLGPELVHFGIALILLSSIASSQLASRPIQGEWTSIDLGGELAAGGYTIRLLSLELVEDEYVESGWTVTAEARATLGIMRSDGSVGAVVVLRDLYGIAEGSGMVSKLDSDVYVHSSIVSDLCLGFEWSTEMTAIVYMKVVPMMSGLWVGLVIAVSGATIRMMTWSSTSTSRQVTTVQED